VEAPAILLMGPTGAGKSDFAAGLARRLPVEIVSGDSALVSRGMDIGTAKPTATERARVPHHLIDVVDPTESYSAGRFRDDAIRAVEGILGRGNIPLLVGGTMLYYRALAQGIDALPAAQPTLRAEIEARAARLGWPALHAELARVDPVTAARLSPNDAQRIQRALEVCLLTGQPMSAQLGRRSGAAVDALWIALVPQDRALLHARIARRFDAMLAAGLVDELRGLRARYRLSPDLPAMRCVGYRQAWQHLDGELDASELRDTAIAATRQLAKRQLTWLRSMTHRHVVACDDTNAVANVLRLARQLAAQTGS